MSHYSQVQSEMNDIDAIKKACADLGLTITQGGSVSGYYGKGSNADWVINIPGVNYEVGLVKDQITGNYRMVYDKWNGSVESKLGENCRKLVQASTFQKFAPAAEERGWLVAERVENTQKQSLHVALERWVQD
jgi:hypothetical protein